MTLAPVEGLVFDADRAVVVAAGLTVSVCAELVDAVWPDPLEGWKAAVSDSGDPLAGKEVVQVAVPDASSGWLAQPEIVPLLSEKATVPAGVDVPVPLVETVADSVTGWLVLAGDGLAVASFVVVDVVVVPETTVAVTLCGV